MQTNQDCRGRKPIRHNQQESQGSGSELPESEGTQWKLQGFTSHASLSGPLSTQGTMGWLGTLRLSDAKFLCLPFCSFSSDAAWALKCLSKKSVLMHIVVARGCACPSVTYLSVCADADLRVCVSHGVWLRMVGELRSKKSPEPRLVELRVWMWDRGRRQEARSIGIKPGSMRCFQPA